MKKIEQCLDIILQELVKNWDKPNNEKDSLKRTTILKQFDLKDYMQKDEFFKRLIDRLVKDGYAEILETGKPFYSPDHYEEDTLITIEGYYFIKEQNGYTEELERKVQSEITRRALETRMATSTSDLAKWTKRLYRGTVVVGVGACGLVLWEIIKTVFFEHNFCH